MKIFRCKFRQFNLQSLVCFYIVYPSIRKFCYIGPLLTFPKTSIIAITVNSLH